MPHGSLNGGCRQEAGTAPEPDYTGEPQTIEEENAERLARQAKWQAIYKEAEEALERGETLRGVKLVDGVLIFE